MRHGTWMLVMIAGLGCAEQSVAPGAAAPAPLGTEVRSLPETATPTFVDFGGKVRLVGYELSGELPARAGSKLTVDLYWESAAALEPGWELSTELREGGAALGEQNEPARARDGEKAGPAGWRLGRIYRDQQTLQVPDELSGSTLTIVASVGLTGANYTKTAGTPPFHLPVLSGPHEGDERGVVAHVEAVAGKVPPKPKKPERDRRRRDDPPWPRPAASGR